MTIPYTVASPSPLPSPAGLVVKNGSKARSATSSDIPVPVSDTCICDAALIDPAQVDGEQTSIGHRIAGVGREVEEQLLELLDIDRYEHGLVRGRDGQLTLAVERSLEQWTLLRRRPCAGRQSRDWPGRGG